jgi:hypothetical protein
MNNCEHVSLFVVTITTKFSHGNQSYIFKVVVFCNIRVLYFNCGFLLS